MNDVVNFSAGPSALPRPALERAQKELLDFQGTGISIIEHSHRGQAYSGVHEETLSLVRSLFEVPSSHDILLIQGGASGLFGTIPLNFVREGQSADYVVTGAWSKKALAEAQTVGQARTVATGEVDGKFVRIPGSEECKAGQNAAYVHLTSNNTIAGTQFQAFPDTGQVPLVADMSSDIMSRPLDVGRFGLIYAGAQKNLGPSGVALVIISRAWMEKARTDIPKIFRFQTHAAANSLYHTPPTFSVYLMRNVLDWIKESGGLTAIAKKNHEKAKALYEAIDESDGFYRSPVELSARSQMNVVFRLPTEDLEKAFLATAEEHKLQGLKGHRSVGGLRASIYNAMPIDGVARLVAVMRAFRKKHA